MRRMIIGQKKTLIISALIIIFVVILNHFYFFTPLENKIYDFTLLIKSFIIEPEMDNVLLISIDDKTLDRLGPWPIKRGYYADIIEELEDAGAAAVGLDLILNEPSESGEDQKLTNVLRKYDNIVLPVVADIEKISDAYGDEFSNMKFLKPYKSFADNSRLGHINFIQDRDGIIRKFHAVLGEKFGDSRNLFDSFDLELIKSTGKKIPQSDLFSLNRGTFIDFIGTSNIIPRISFLDILDGKYESAKIEDRIVVIGVNSIGQGDRYMTPFSRYGYMTGSQIHVQAISSILRGSNRISLPYITNILISLLIIITSVLIFFHYKPSRATIFLLLFLIIYTTIYIIIFIAFNIIITYITQLFIVFSIYIVSLIDWYFFVNKEKEDIISAFERYLSPMVLQELLKDPTKLRLGGESTYLTVIFIDIRQFTFFAENKSPEEVVELLNETFEKISSVIFKYQGTLDKFTGDGVMAFFGAPLKASDHAVKAILAAAEIQELESPFQFGIGINTGTVIVGNIGSSNRLEYTVIGDTVNKAARFVDIASPGEIIMGVETYKNKDMDIRNLIWETNLIWKIDEVRLKGSQNKVEVYRTIISDETRK